MRTQFVPRIQHSASFSLQILRVTISPSLSSLLKIQNLSCWQQWLIHVDHVCFVRGLGNVLTWCTYTRTWWDRNEVVGREEGWRGHIAQVTLTGEDQEGRELDGWCGGARPKKSHQCLPKVGAGGLSCGRAPEHCLSLHSLPTSGRLAWAEG